MNLTEKIKALKEEKNGIILAHNYQPDEIQDIADITGDSLELARIAAKNDADLIIFCGVHFMAESAAILSPDKKVLLPEKTAGCPMADMVTAEKLIELKKEYPKAKVVTYINSTAAVKAESDVVCTSSNAKRIVQKVEGDQIIFVPDKNLGSYVQKFTDKEIILWKGFCPTHENVTEEDFIRIKKENPGAITITHPECRPGVLDLSDEILSTGEMVTFVQKTDKKEIIVGTEIGMIHKLKSVAPDKKYIPATKSFICPNMKKITLEKLYNSILNEETQIKVDLKIAEKAKLALDKMLELS